MEVQRGLIDKDFDRYVLALSEVQKKEARLQSAVLEPLQAINKTRKAQWDARIHYNALVSDPYYSRDLHAVVAYFIDSEFQLVQVTASVEASSNDVMTRPIYQFATSVKRKDNVSLQVADKGLLVYCDGSGTLSFLKHSNPDATSGSCEILYECTPVGIVPLLLLKTAFDEATQSFHTLLAEPLEGVDQEASFRLWAMTVSCAQTSGSMDIDSGAVGLQHEVFEVALIESLPGYVSFNGPDVIMLLEGNVSTTIEMQANWNDTTISTDHNHATKRHHDESEQEEDNDEHHAKLPRAGIGFHGDISDIKHSHEGGSLDMSVPLETRFHKSSVPFSSLDEPSHNTTGNTPPNIGKLEVPTTETILGGFEECDDLDPNAKAVLLLVNMTQKVVQDKIESNCRNFRYLCPSEALSSPALLFQHDVNGLVFNVDIVASRLQLTHTFTFPAFGFVQASKQDKKLMMFEPFTQVVCIAEFEKRVFIYHGAATDQEKQSHTRKQHVVEFGEHQVLGMRIVGSSVMLLTPHHITLAAL